MPTSVKEAEPRIILARCWGNTTLHEFASNASGPIKALADKIGKHVIIADLRNQDAGLRLWPILSRKMACEIAEAEIISDDLLGIGLAYSIPMQKVAAIGILKLLKVENREISSDLKTVLKWARGVVSSAPVTMEQRPPSLASSASDVIHLPERTCIICGNKFKPWHSATDRKHCYDVMGCGVEAHKRGLVK